MSTSAVSTSLDGLRELWQSEPQSLPLLTLQSSLLPFCASKGTGFPLFTLPGGLPRGLPGGLPRGLSLSAEKPPVTRRAFLFWFSFFFWHSKALSADALDEDVWDALPSDISLPDWMLVFFFLG